MNVLVSKEDVIQGLYKDVAKGIIYAKRKKFDCIIIMFLKAQSM